MTNRAEKRRQERRGSTGGGGSSSRLGLILGVVAVLAIAIVGWNLFSSVTDQTARTAVAVEYENPDELIQMAQGIPTGNPDAPVTIMEFGDYQCPACQSFFRQAKPILDVSYIQPGRVQFVFYDFPLENAHPNAFIAARAARCAGDQDAYWQFHDVLFQNQMQWAGQADPVGDFVAYAEGLGLDASTFRSCVRSDRHAEVVSANAQLAMQLGAQSTPTVILDPGDGRAIRVDNWSTSLRPMLEELLAAAGDPSALGAEPGTDPDEEGGAP